MVVPAQFGRTKGSVTVRRRLVASVVSEVGIPLWSRDRSAHTRHN